MQLTLLNNNIFWESLNDVGKLYIYCSNHKEQTHLYEPMIYVAILFSKLLLKKMDHAFLFWNSPALWEKQLNK